MPVTILDDGNEVYASVDDVRALNRGRSISATSIPCASDVQVFLEMSTGEINALLTQKGYQLPIATGATAALGYLRSVNAQGAYAMTEKSSQSSIHIRDATAAYERALRMLADADTVLDIPRVDAIAMPRGPGFTTPHVGHVITPRFRRGMRF